MVRQPLRGPTSILIPPPEGGGKAGGRVSPTHANYTSPCRPGTERIVNWGTCVPPLHGRRPDVIPLGDRSTVHARAMDGSRGYMDAPHTHLRSTVPIHGARHPAARGLSRGRTISLRTESSVSGRGRAPCSVNESAGVRHSLDPGEARTERCAGAQLGPPSVFHSTCELGLQGCPSGPHGP